MKYADIKAMMAEIAPVIREYTAAAVEPLSERLDAIEAQLASLPSSRDSKGVDEDAIVERVTAKMAREIAQVRAAVDAISIPEIPDVEGMIAGALDAINEQRSQDAAQVRVLINEVNKRIDNLPAPEKGDKGDKGEKGERGEPGRDGLDVKDMFRADGGRLIAVMSDGSTRDLGVFVGKDGKDGEPGRDGLGFDDMRMEERDDGCYLVFERGEIVKEFRLPVVIDRGVYSAGKVYRKGDGVTWAGSFWIAQEDTSEKPDTGKGWRLAVKKGRDGKDGVLKAEKSKEPVKVG